MLNENQVSDLERLYFTCENGEDLYGWHFADGELARVLAEAAKVPEAVAAEHIERLRSPGNNANPWNDAIMRAQYCRRLKSPSVEERTQIAALVSFESRIAGAKRIVEASDAFRGIEIPSWAAPDPRRSGQEANYPYALSGGRGYDAVPSISQCANRFANYYYAPAGPFPDRQTGADPAKRNEAQNGSMQGRGARSARARG